MARNYLSNFQNFDFYLNNQSEIPMKSSEDFRVQLQNKGKGMILYEIYGCEERKRAEKYSDCPKIDINANLISSLPIRRSKIFFRHFAPQSEKSESASDTHAAL